MKKKMMKEIKEEIEFTFLMEAFSTSFLTNICEDQRYWNWTTEKVVCLFSTRSSSIQFLLFCDGYFGVWEETIVSNSFIYL